MNRRAFLRLTVRGRERVLDLSCERLYMRWVDARMGGAVDAAGLDALGGPDGVGANDGLSVRDGLGTAAASHAPAASPSPAFEWDGEPPLEVVIPTADELFGELERELAGVQVLRVTGREWLAAEGFRREVESRIYAFRRRGGRVE